MNNKMTSLSAVDAMMLTQLVPRAHARATTPIDPIKYVHDGFARNKACPCGSGKKFKRCHGPVSTRLADGTTAYKRTSDEKPNSGDVREDVRGDVQDALGLERLQGTHLVLPAGDGGEPLQRLEEVKSA